MPRYVAILTHPPNLCPASNKAVRAVVEKLPSELPAALQKHGVKLLSDNVLGPSHKAVLVLEAPSTETVRQFIQETGLVQWNDVTIYPSLPIKETLKGAALGRPTLF